ncbi:MAG: hypothetical protein HYZ57_07670 [Acidobacteria bacterium]|nr:hypothetical protein [Acidobacteriota bacterium]
MKSAAGHVLIPWAVLVLFSSAGLAQSGTGRGVGGPSILSRGGERPGERGGEPIQLSVYGAISASYDSSLIARPLVTSSTAIPKVGLYGGEAEWGALGSHRWRRSQIGLDYRGTYGRYSRRGFLDGSQQILSLAYGTQLSRRWGITLQETAGTSNRAFGGLYNPGLVSSDLLGVPTNELFDYRFYFTQTSAYATYRRSSRVMFDFGGDYFNVKRRSALISVEGYRAVGQVTRVLSRRSEVGAGYVFMHFGYPRAFGASDMHGVTIVYSHQFGRRWSLNVRLGGYRVETLATRRVQLSPEVAAILGTRFGGVEASYRVNYMPQGDLTLTYRLRRSLTATLSYSRGVSPGNGVYLTSAHETAGGGLSYSGRSRLSLGGTAGYSRYNSLFQTTEGAYKNYFASLQGAIRITGALHFTSSIGYRFFDTTGVQNRGGYFARIGLAFYPGSVPLPIW